VHKQPIIKSTFDSVTVHTHHDYPMFAVSEDGRVLGARGLWLNPAAQPSGHQHVAYFDTTGKKRYVHIHRLVALCYVHNRDPETLTKVDHQDTNPANNHYTNLRWVTARQNCQNLAKNKAGTTSSKYVGVGWHKQRKVWRVQIRLDGRNKGLGSFKDEVDAAKAYDQALVSAGLAPVNFSLINE
jgi:hypothetical protein